MSKHVGYTNINHGMINILCCVLFSNIANEVNNLIILWVFSSAVLKQAVGLSEYYYYSVNMQSHKICHIHGLKEKRVCSQLHLFAFDFFFGRYCNFIFKQSETLTK